MPEPLLIPARTPAPAPSPSYRTVQEAFPAPSLRIIEAHPERGTVVELRGELDVFAALALGPDLDTLTARPVTAFVLDLRAAPFIDAGGLELLARAVRRVAAHGGRAALVSTSPFLVRLLRLLGAQGLLEVYADVETALAALRQS